VTQSIKSTRRHARLEISGVIADSFTRLELARSQSLYTDLSSTAAIRFQIELRNIVLGLLGEVRSDLAHQMYGIATRDRSRPAPHRKDVRDILTCRVGRQKLNGGRR
jgi:hypothetical protein